MYLTEQPRARRALRSPCGDVRALPETRLHGHGSRAVVPTPPSAQPPYSASACRSQRLLPLSEGGAGSEPRVPALPDHVLACVRVQVRTPPPPRPAPSTHASPHAHTTAAVQAQPRAAAARHECRIRRGGCGGRRLGGGAFARARHPHVRARPCGQPGEPPAAGVHELGVGDGCVERARGVAARREHAARRAAGGGAAHRVAARRPARDPAGLVSCKRAQRAAVQLREHPLLGAAAVDARLLRAGVQGVLHAVRGGRAPAPPLPPLRPHLLPHLLLAKAPPAAQVRPRVHTPFARRLLGLLRGPGRN